jgi:pimeloyl-ACP methyl ester carboxylesterase
LRSDALFIPHGKAHLSAVISAPTGRAHGVAIFPLRTPVLGMAGSVFWAQAAARLAAHSIASVRFEHAGSGDSTGTLAAGGVAAIAEPVAETLTVAGFATDALGLDFFATAGFCYGGAVAIAAARDPRCTAVVSINTALAEPGWLRCYGERQHDGD